MRIFDFRPLSASQRALVRVNTAQGKRKGKTRGEILRRPPEPAGAPPLTSSAVAPIMPMNVRADAHVSSPHVSRLSASPKIALRVTCVHYSSPRTHASTHGGGASDSSPRSTDRAPSHGHALNVGSPQLGLALPQRVCGAAYTSTALSHT